MKMKSLLSLLASLVAVFLVVTVVQAAPPQAADDSPTSDVPEINGDYPDPRHPGIRVRVFVHGPKARTTSSPALSCTDPDSSAVTGAAGWKLPAGTWTYNLNPGSAPSSTLASNLATISASGFAQYANALSTTSSKPVFARGADTSVSRTAYDGKNIIAWGRISASALGITYIRYSSTTHIAVDVDTVLNKRYAWNWNGGSALTCGTSNSYDVQNILTHEQGHWLGLDDEYDTTHVDNTMYGYGAKGEVKKDTLTTGDTIGIQAIYP